MFFVGASTGPATLSVWTALVMTVTFTAIIAVTRREKRRSNNGTFHWPKTQIAVATFMALYTVSLAAILVGGILTGRSGMYSFQLWSTFVMGIFAMTWGVCCACFMALYRGLGFGLVGLWLVSITAKVAAGMESFYTDNQFAERINNILPWMSGALWVIIIAVCAWWLIKFARRRFSAWRQRHNEEDTTDTTGDSEDSSNDSQPAGSAPGTQGPVDPPVARP